MAEQQAPTQAQQDEAAKAAADKAAADKAAAEKATAAKPAQQAKAPALVVTGAVAVLALKGGGERYVYRGSPVDAALYTAESVKHHQAVGLVGKPKK